MARDRRKSKSCPAALALRRSVLGPIQGSTDVHTIPEESVGPVRIQRTEAIEDDSQLRRLGLEAHLSWASRRNRDTAAVCCEAGPKKPQSATIKAMGMKRMSPSTPLAIRAFVIQVRAAAKNREDVSGP